MTTVWTLVRRLPALGFLLWIGMAIPTAAVAAAAAARAPAPPGDAAPGLSRQTAAIASDVARLRGLALRREVPVRTLSRGGLEAMLWERVDADLPPAKARGLELVLEAFGWVEPGFEVREAIIGLMTSQAAAVYDPETATYIFVEGIVDSQLVDMISSHELVHALTDQHFNLDSLLVRPAREGRLTEDQGQALRFLVEGDATYVMMMRALGTAMGMLLEPSAGSAAGANAGLLDSAIRSALVSIPKLPYSDLVKMFGGNMGLGQDVGAAAAALDSLPVVLVRPLLDAYLRGAALVGELRARGGWAAVDSLYRNPPSSTEQVLHPEKLHPVRDEPRTLSLAAVAKQNPSGRVSFEETLGELYVITLFEANGMADEAEAMAAGWDGDRIAVIETGASWSAVWATMWDGEEEALQFERGLARLLDRRSNPNADTHANANADTHANANADPSSGDRVWMVHERPMLLGRRGDCVAIVQAGGVEAARELLRAALQAEPAGASPVSSPER